MGGMQATCSLIPITVDDAALPEAISGVVLPSVAIHNPKSKNGIRHGSQERPFLGGLRPPQPSLPGSGAVRDRLTARGEPIEAQVG